MIKVFVFHFKLATSCSNTCLFNITDSSEMLVTPDCTKNAGVNMMSAEKKKQKQNMKWFYTGKPVAKILDWAF